MSISDNHKKTLKGLHDTATSTGQGYTFANPKAPMIAQLINSGHVTADHNYQDPADKAKVAVALTRAGVAELPAPATQAPVGPSFGIPGPAEADTIQEGQEAIQEGTQDAAGTDRVRKVRGPRVTPVIATGIGRFAMPETTRRGGRGGKADTYPFASLEAPNEQGLDAFHVAATPAMPNPAKTLAGTVSSANKRHKKEGVEPKEFKVIAGNHPVTGVPGAMVYRTK